MNPISFKEINDLAPQVQADRDAKIERQAETIISEINQIIKDNADVISKARSFQEFKTTTQWSPDSISYAFVVKKFSQVGVYIKIKKSANPEHSNTLLIWL